MEEFLQFLEKHNLLTEGWLIFYTGLAISFLIFLLGILTIWLWKYFKISRFSPDSVFSGELVGRDEVLKQLDKAWKDSNIHIFMLYGWAGTGKTAIVDFWRRKLAKIENSPPETSIFRYSFQNCGKYTGSRDFFEKAFQKFSAFDSEANANSAESENSGTVIPKKFDTEREKGQFLAELIENHHVLLILDGLEEFLPQGELRMKHESDYRIQDDAIFTLLKSLAKHNTGLCLLTSREPLDERIAQYENVQSQQLKNLKISEAVQLLRNAKVKGKEEELRNLAETYHGHPHSLALIAGYLEHQCDRDIRRLDNLTHLTDMHHDTQFDPERDGKDWRERVTAEQTYWVMEGYKKSLGESPKLGLLYLLSLFDEAVERELLMMLIDAILKRRPYPLEEMLFEPFRDSGTWKQVCRDLRERGLLIAEGETLNLPPLVRDFFRHDCKQHAWAIWQQAHLELYDYYKNLPEKEFPDTREAMQPLFHAVAHGCAAELHQQALDEVYWQRIKRENEHYLTKKLGAFSDDLAVVSHFFEKPWRVPAQNLEPMWQAGVLNWAGFDLRALGRLREAVEPIRAGMENSAQQKDWKGAAQGASNLSELQLTVGDVADAVETARQSVDYADQSEDLFMRMYNHTTHAEALHQARQHDEALALFQEAEQIQQDRQPEYPHLYSLQGFRYCDLLLAQGKTAKVLERATQTLEWAQQQGTLLLDIALDQLTLGRAHLQLAFLLSPAGRRTGDERHLQQAKNWLNQAVDGLRESGNQDDLPRGLLARAAYYRQTDNFTAAHKDLQEVFEIAERSGMRLFLTDYHLEMVRLLRAENKPENDAQTHIEKAAKLIEETGYHRRDGALAELQKGIIS